MKQILQRALAATAGFIAGYVGIALLFAGFVMGSRGLSGSLATGWLESLAMMGYFVTLYGVMSGLAYAVLAALSRHWKQRRRWPIAGWSALAGAAGCALYWTGLVQMLRFGALLGVPAGAWIATMLPGIVAGLVVIVWAAVVKPPT